jgi:hypothetical protein
MSKYEPLWKFFIGRDDDLIELTFNEIQRILGFPIDHSFLNYKKELQEKNYTVKKISLKEKIVVFEKITKKFQ